MGMFDYVNYSCDCPACKATVSSFQTKQKECLMDTLDPDDVDYFYSSCPNCGVWIDVRAEPPVERKYIVTFKQSGYKHGR